MVVGSCTRLKVSFILLRFLLQTAEQHGWAQAKKRAKTRPKVLTERLKRAANVPVGADGACVMACEAMLGNRGGMFDISLLEQYKNRRYLSLGFDL